jgi:hypothetical protein
MNDDLQAINDRLAICESMARFCRTLDTKDWVGFADTLSDDVTLDIAEDTHIPIIEGRAAVLEVLQTRLGAATTVHQVHSPEIELKGDQANVIWARHDRVVAGPKGRSITGYGHYYSRWVRRDDGWKMASLKPTTLHVDVDPPREK